jgi:hypothetical protein
VSNWYHAQRARRESARRFERSERECRWLAAETPSALPSPELLPPTAEEIAEAEAAEERYLAEQRRSHYAPGELAALRRSQLQD